MGVPSEGTNVRELREICQIKVVSEHTNRQVPDEPIARELVKEKEEKSIIEEGAHLCPFSSSLYADNRSRPTDSISGHYASGLDMFHDVLGGEESCQFTFHGPLLLPLGLGTKQLYLTHVPQPISPIIHAAVTRWVYGHVYMQKKERKSCSFGAA
jgi:hypothetical protein